MQNIETQGVLAPTELAQFQKSGWVRVTDALPVATVESVRDFYWQKMAEAGMRRDDPTTWSQKWMGINKNAFDLAIGVEIGPRLQGAVDQLLGVNNWRPLKTLGGVLQHFPEGDFDAWQVRADTWHTDNNPRTYFAGVTELMLFTFYSPVRPRGGGTLALAGSHHLLEHLLTQHPELSGLPSLNEKLAALHPFLADLLGPNPSPNRSVQKWMGQKVIIEGIEIEVVELTGEPGDAILCHPALLHASSMNCGPEPRIMRRTNFRRIK